MDDLKKIEFYKSALHSVQVQLRQEKEGLILDSGRVIPHYNTATIKKLEEMELELKAEIAGLENPKVTQ